MIYLLISATGEYEYYSETIHGYFKSKEQAEEKLKQLEDFDKLIFAKFKGRDDCYYDEGDFQRRCYRKFGINAYIDYNGISWKITEVKEFKQ